jgi:hypothetical protein
VPILAVIAAIIITAAAVSIGQQLGHDVAPLLAIAAPIALALVIYAALYFWHKRRMRELAQGRYDLKHDQLGWRRITVKAHDRWYICSDCGMPCPDLKSSEAHSAWHDELAALLAGEPLEEDDDSMPWSAVTEGSVGAEPEVPELPDTAEPVPVPPRPTIGQIGEYEAKAIAFRRSMSALLRTGGRDRDGAEPDA